ncbi:MAG: putative Ig domain-containing protein [Planctomycetes bacterium]|nr:putative Ig domain-containing protein [Planctomycetota bacterium]
MKYVLMLATLLFPLCLDAQSYSLTTGTSTFQRLGSPTMLALGDDELSSAISPNGFSFDYFGTTYTEFKVCSNGFIVIGGAGTLDSSIPFPSWAPGLTIAPLWRDLYPTNATGSDGIGWEFSGGVLTIEWDEVPCFVTGFQLATPYANVQVVLDTNDNSIEFRYGDSNKPQSGPPEPDANWYCASIAGPTSPAPQEIINGAYSPYFDNNGQLLQYAGDIFMRFEPQSAPTITTTPTLDAYVGQLWSYSFAVSGAPIPGVTVLGLPGWLTLNGHTIEGTPGEGDLGTTGMITVQATNGLGSDVQQFQINVLQASPPVSGVTGGGGGCATRGDAGLLWLALIGVAGFAGFRRRMG